VGDVVELGPLASLADVPGTSAVLTDFDGTLAPIVSDPDVARPLPQAAATLARLAQRFAVVGVVSGRPAQFLAAQLADAGPSVHLVGLYGLEWVQGGTVHRLPEVEPWRAVVADTVTAARGAFAPGVKVEPKEVALTLNWRRAPAAGERVLDFAHRYADRTGLVLQPGRLSVELRPPVAMDKGEVVKRLAATCRAACFFGDDVADLAAFSALDVLAQHGAVTVRVAIAAGEPAPAVVRASDLVIDDPAAAVAVLDALAQAADRA
jgi:trehalose 6-phosphate phosphatase